MWKRLSAVCLGLAVAGSMACVGDEFDDESEEVEQSALNITTSYHKTDNVKGFKYDIKPVKCPSNSVKKGLDYEDSKNKHSEVKPLKDLKLPGGFEKFEDDPFDKDSKHQFADYLKLVDAGCYDVKVTPVDKYNKPVESCTSASRKAVPVYPGEMTEIMLVSQCAGAERGLLDVVAAVNTAPSLVDFKIIDNKFSACDKYEKKTKVKVCAVAEDREKDPMNFKWEPTPKKTSVKSELGKKQYGECATYKLGDSVQDYKLTVFDKFIDKDGKPIRAEKWYKKSEDYPSKGDGKDLIESRAEQYYDIHVSCDSKEKLPICPKDKKYWKDKMDKWPVSGSKKICKKSWNEIMTTKIGKDMKSSKKALYTLGQQYITAYLNKKSNAEVPRKVGARMFMAKALLNKCNTFKLPGVQFVAHKLANYLKDFNTGKYSNSDKCTDING